MASDSPPIDEADPSMLTEHEVKELSWEGMLIEGEDEEYSASFIATDERLIISLGSGHFKDIGLNHIESVEVNTETKSNIEGTNPDGALGVGVGVAIVGLFIMFVGGFSPLASFGGLMVSALGGYMVWWSGKNYDKLEDDFEVTEYTVYHVLLRTPAESPFSMPIYLKTNMNVGPELSKLVRKSQ